ncbi:class I SAM-dependent methyltransferase [Winogradskyella sp.]|uniref:class I SAM-dependent methyltransferase n=1 Tax=Winogradskyella sp. TaxID=1883156 RepID=UPI0025E6295C|nr:class I SAM-dependent methyltransferase [Winogradskyella sp.]MBT8245312.1 class I SAM-dependent methyltransferase [Winogradskyella sp.]
MSSKTYIPALGYNWLTNFYDLAICITMPEKRFRTKLIDLVNPLKGENILEFGFGTGENLILGVNRNADVQFKGLDIDPKVKRIAEKKFKANSIDVRLDIYNGDKFPYQNNAFDKVFSSLVFHQLDAKTKESSLNEIHRILKPNGVLIIGDWGKPKSKMMRIMFYFVQILDGFATTKDNVNGKLPTYMKKSGFMDVVETGYINTKIGTYCYYKGMKRS